MFRALFLMFVLLAGLVAGPYLAGKQGYVLIQTENYNYELSVVTFVILFVIAMAVVYVIEWLVTRFLRLSRNTYGWFGRRKRAKAQQQTLEGLMRMGEGNYSKAEKLIGKNAKHSAEPVLNLIKAAEAAQQRGDEFSANKYLMDATELAGSDNLLVELARTKILLQQNKLPAARSSVDSLLELAPKNVEVVKLAVEIYKKSKAYAALDDLLDQAEGLYSDAEFTALSHELMDGLLDEKMNEDGADGLLAWWEDQSRKRRNDSYARVGLIQRLIDCNDQESAYELTLDTFKRVEDNKELEPALLAQITRLQPVDSTKLVKLLEKRANSNQQNVQCWAQRALGYLQVRNGDFAKASDAFKKVLAMKDQMQPNDTTMAAYVFEQIGDIVTAKEIREASLKAAMAVSEQA